MDSVTETEAGDVSECLDLEVLDLHIPIRVVLSYDLVDEPLGNAENLNWNRVIPHDRLDTLQIVLVRRTKVSTGLGVRKEDEHPPTKSACPSESSS